MSDITSNAIPLYNKRLSKICTWLLAADGNQDRLENAIYDDFQDSNLLIAEDDKRRLLFLVVNLQNLIAAGVVLPVNDVQHISVFLTESTNAIDLSTLDTFFLMQSSNYYAVEQLHRYILRKILHKQNKKPVKSCCAIL